MRQLALKGANETSDIFFSSGILPVVGEFCMRRFSPTCVHIVTDGNVHPLYYATVAKSFSIPVTHSILPPGEEHKNLATVERLYADFCRAGLTRRDLVIALGGGVVGDITAFAAATYLRGVPVCQIPTTLLAQVDSSVGGKCGVDLPQGKNLVGAFYQPALVLIDPDVLDSLSPAILADGQAEVVKYGMIAQPEILSLVQNFDQNREEIIFRCVRIKRDIVQQDEFDTGGRMVLNFGHTVGHAVEKLGHYTAYSHGQAVAIGMVAALKISQEEGLCSKELIRETSELLKKLGLPVTHPYPPQDLCAAMLSDKKKLGDQIHFVLLESPGRPVIRPIPVPTLGHIMLSII